MFQKRLEKGRIVWPSANEGKVALTLCPVVDAAGAHRLTGAAADAATLGRGKFYRVINQ